jgi:hypothetical protein
MLSMLSKHSFSQGYWIEFDVCLITLALRWFCKGLSLVVK